MTDKSVDEILVELRDKVVHCEIYLVGCDCPEYIKEAKTKLRELVMGCVPKKDGVPKYPKGSDGECLTFLQTGYNQAITETTKAIEEVLK